MTDHVYFLGARRYECANQTDGVVFEWPLASPLAYTPTFTYHGFR